MAIDDDEPVPRLPRGRGIKLSRPQLIRLVFTALMLVLIIVAQKPCAEAVSTFVTSFGDEGSGSARAPAEYEKVPDNMTEADYKAMVERQKAKAAARRGSGSDK